MQRPLSGIDQTDVKAPIGNIVARGRDAQAHWVYSALSSVFSWLVDDGQLEISPMAKLKPTVLIGRKAARSRVLDDHELGAYWRAADALAYPFGKLFQTLALTALRRDEASEAVWSEIDMAAKLWVIPGRRMKNGAAHSILLTPDILLLLEGLPRFHGGPFVWASYLELVRMSAPRARTARAASRTSDF